MPAAPPAGELVEQAVLCGFTGIDTACQPKHYREDLVGAALERLQQVRSDSKAARMYMSPCIAKQTQGRCR